MSRLISDGCLCSWQMSVSYERWCCWLFFSDYFELSCAACLNGNISKQLNTVDYSHSFIEGFSYCLPQSCFWAMPLVPGMVAKLSSNGADIDPCPVFWLVVFGNILRCFMLLITAAVHFDYSCQHLVSFEKFMFPLMLLALFCELPRLLIERNICILALKPLSSILTYLLFNCHQVKHNMVFRSLYLDFLHKLHIALKKYCVMWQLALQFIYHKLGLNCWALVKCFN